FGVDPDTGAEVGIETERHAITFAGSGGGKGAGLIIPNLMRWPYAALVIDPKGENAEKTAKARKDMGQKVGVFDPFEDAKVGKRLRVSINPLNPAGKPDVVPSREDILAIADGIVRRTDPEADKWDNGARTIIAGMIDYVCRALRPDQRTLPMARRALMQPDGEPGRPARLDGEGREIEPALPATGLIAIAEEMTTLGGLATAAGVSILTALRSGRGADSEYLSGARQHSSWLDSPEMEAALSSTTFKLSDLAKGKASLFVVLSYGRMELYGAFLRLVVRVAQNTIAEAGNRRGPDQKCLFILDEFATLGTMTEIQKAFGNMRSYGLQIWPFLQDYGQLEYLYGKSGSGTFFANSDAQIYFNLSDDMTLDRVSNLLDKTLPNEAAEGPPDHDAFQEVPFKPFIHSRWYESKDAARLRHEVDQRNAKEKHESARRGLDDKYRHKMAAAGGARMPPDKVAELTGKRSATEPSEFMIVFAPAGDVLKVKLAPYYNNPLPALVPVEAKTNNAIGMQELTRAQMLKDVKAHDNIAGYKEVGYYVAEFLIYNIPFTDKIEQEIGWALENGHYKWYLAGFTALVALLIWAGFITIPNLIGGLILLFFILIAIKQILPVIGYAVVKFYRLKFWLRP
ncbi:type IV secretory system conjugative DNA transfer family protein, partial [Methylobacterium komagatae]